MMEGIWDVKEVFTARETVMPFSELQNLGEEKSVQNKVLEFIYLYAHTCTYYISVCI